MMCDCYNLEVQLDVASLDHNLVEVEAFLALLVHRSYKDWPKLLLVHLGLPCQVLLVVKNMAVVIALQAVLDILLMADLLNM